MTDPRVTTIPGDKVTPSGRLARTDCPWNACISETCYLYPAPLVRADFFWCFGCGTQGSFQKNANGSYTLRAESRDVANQEF